MVEKGYKQTKEHEHNIRKSCKGRECLEETRKKISDSNKGQKRSKETRKNISLAKKGKTSWAKGLNKYIDNRILKLFLSKMGHKHSKETKIKMSLAKKGKSYEDIYGKEYADKKKAILHNKKKKYWENKKGKTLEEIYGIEKAKKIKRKISIQTKKSMSNENVKNKLKNGLIEYYKHNEHPRQNKKHSKETIKKIKSARANQIFPVTDTSIEVKIQNFLKQLGIDFFTHQYIKEIEHSYQCDILIPSMNLVIECDGDYWHKYPIGKDIDHIRTNELIEKGFKVLRLWEREIRVMNVEDLQNKLGEYE